MSLTAIADTGPILEPRSIGSRREGFVREREGACQRKREQREKEGIKRGGLGHREKVCFFRRILKNMFIFKAYLFNF